MSQDEVAMQVVAPLRLNRRARRHQETIEEILDIATDVMSEEGVNGLSLAEAAGHLGQAESVDPFFAHDVRGDVEDLLDGLLVPSGASVKPEWGDNLHRDFILTHGLSIA